MRFCSMHLEISSPLEILVEQLARHQTISWHLDYAIEFAEPSAKSVAPFSVSFTNALGSPVTEVVLLVRLRVGYRKCSFDDSIPDLGGRYTVSLLETASVHMGYNCHWASQEFGHIRCYIVLDIHSHSLIVSRSLGIAKSGGSGV